MTFENIFRFVAVWRWAVGVSVRIHEKPES